LNKLMLGLAKGVARGVGGMARGAGSMASRARMPSTRRGKFALGAGIGLGGMAAIRGRSSGSNGLNPRSSGGATGM
jgi:hypothetical protein